MNLVMKGLIPLASEYHMVDIFGYSSHGLPGVEIIGLSKGSRLLKEKLIFVTRKNNIKLPLRRFVICIEGEIENKKFKDEEFRFLEAPILIMLWTLSGHLPLNKLDDCFSIGKINTEGELLFTKPELFQNSILKKLLQLNENINLKVIAPDKSIVGEEYYHLSYEGLIHSVLDRETI